MNSFDCERLHEVAPELALGIADGEDRARALAHLADCPACRAHLERLSAVADELLLIAPSAEPPPGFEERVVGSVEPRQRRPTLARRLAIPALAASAAAVIAAVVVWTGLGDDRELADSYRETLAVANGEYFDAAALEAPGGAKVGYVYGYEGRASWVLAVVYDGVRDGRYRLGLVTDDGERKTLRWMDVSEGEGSEGAVTPMAYHRVAEVRLLSESGHEVAEADLHD